MDRAETLQIMKMLAAAYPARYKDMTKAERETAMSAWAFEEPFEKVERAVREAINTKTFHPSVSEVRAILDRDMSSCTASYHDLKRMIAFRREQLQNDPAKLEAFNEQWRNFADG